MKDVKKNFKEKAHLKIRQLINGFREEGFDLGADTISQVVDYSYQYYCELKRN